MPSLNGIEGSQLRYFLIRVFSELRPLTPLGASRSLSGEFSKEIKKLLDEITRTRVFLEAHIDFPEEEIGEIEILKIKISLLSFLQQKLNKTT